MKTLSAALAAVVVSFSALGAQNATTASTAAISGVVRDARTGRPVPGAIVLLRHPGGTAPLATITRHVTDSQGRYLFQQLPAAQGYTVRATKPGYIEGAYGQQAMFGPDGRITLGEAAWFSRGDIPLWPSGAISGRIADERNEPVVGAHVRLVARVVLGGVSQWIGSAAARTDDRGEYRFAGLVPGTYSVLVPSATATAPAEAQGLYGNAPTDGATGILTMPIPARTDAALAPVEGFRAVIGNEVVPPPDADGRSRVYPTTLYPGVTDVAAGGEVTLALGDHRVGVDVVLQPTTTVNVFGRVSGRPTDIAGLVLRLLLPGLDGLATGGEVSTAVVAADGTFAFLRVPPGRYVLDAPAGLFEYTLQSGTESDRPVAPVGLRVGGGSSGSLDGGPPGTGYRRMSTTRRSTTWARMPLVVGGTDVRDLTVALQDALTVVGRIEYVLTTKATVESVPMGGGMAVGGSSTSTTLFTPVRPSSQPTIAVEPADAGAALGSPRSIRPRADDPDADQDLFTIEGVIPGEYVFTSPRTTQPYMLHSVTLDGMDVTDRPVDLSKWTSASTLVVTFTDQLPVLTVEVQAQPDVTLRGAVVIFPADSRAWRRFGMTPARMQAAMLSGKPSVALPAVPAGEYLMAAVDALPSSSWQDPAFLAKVAPLATPVTVAWGQAQRVTLKQVTVR